MSLIVEQEDLFGVGVVNGVTDGRLSIKLLDCDTADAIIRAQHYSGTVVWSSNEHFGVYWGHRDECLGVLQFGPPMNPASAAKIVGGLEREQLAELNRMWITDDRPDGLIPTRVMSNAIQLLEHRRPEVEVIQSFADERCGKMGAVYQAASFTYCGSHETTFYRLDDEWYHQSMMDRPEYDSRGWWCGPKIAYLNENKDRAEPHTFRQFRYVKCLTKRARRNLLLPDLPYPKPDECDGGNEDAG